MRLIKKRSSATDPTATQPDTSSVQSSRTDQRATIGSDRATPPDSDELDLSTIKLPSDFQAKLEEEEKTASNFLPPPPAATVITHSAGIGTSIFNEIRSDFSLDRFLSLSDFEDWGTDSDLSRECEGLSTDYVDFLLSYE